MTGEGHRAISSRADFIIKGNPREVENALDDAEEFVFENEQVEEEFSGSLHYIWLLRGRSWMPEAPENQASSEGLMLFGSWTAGPGEPDFRTLGDLFLGRGDLTLLCLSRERLEAGKQLLGDLLGKKIQHQQDHFEDLREHLDELDQEDEDYELGEEEIPALSEEFEDEELSAEARFVKEEMIECITMRWLDTPDKKGITPRQAAQTPEGREELRETMKVMEFLGEQALKTGKRPPMRLDIICKELGL